MTNGKMNWIDCGTSVTLIVGGKAHQIASSHANYASIFAALKAQDWDKAAKLADIATAIKTYVSTTSADVEVKGGAVYYKGERLHGVVVERILSFMKENKPTEPLIKFVERLMANPSRGSRERLYHFLERNRVPITANGTFLAYKAVQSNYLSKSAGSEKVEVSTDGGKTFQDFVGHIPNNIGNVIRVDRGMVDDNPNSHCSYGLHAGGIRYVNWFHDPGDLKVIVEVDPADVVSVPTDHDCGKLRACGYTVICDFEGEFTSPLVANATEPYADTDDFDDSEF